MAYFPLDLGQSANVIEHLPAVYHADFSDEGASSSHWSVSEIPQRDILGTRLDQFHDNAKLSVAHFDGFLISDFPVFHISMN